CREGSSRFHLNTQFLQIAWFVEPAAAQFNRALFELVERGARHLHDATIGVHQEEALHATGCDEHGYPQFRATAGPIGDHGTFAGEDRKAHGPFEGASLIIHGVHEDLLAVGHLHDAVDVVDAE